MVLYLEMHKWSSDVHAVCFHAGVGEGLCFCGSYFKFFLRYLFLYPIESGSPESRVNAVHFLVHKLPEKNKEMLDILVKHLAKWVLWPPLSKFLSLPFFNYKGLQWSVAGAEAHFDAVILNPKNQTCKSRQDIWLTLCIFWRERQKSKTLMKP